MAVEAPEGYDEGCLQCGLCCKVFGDRITPTIMNLYTWMEAGRTDILKFFSVCTGKGMFTCAADLNPKDLTDISTIELRNPQTGEYLPYCPFLRRAGKNRYLCSIHTSKPDMCCNYMPWVWGETYFPRCESLKYAEKRSYLNQIRSEDKT